MKPRSHVSVLLLFGSVLLLSACNIGQLLVRAPTPAPSVTPAPRCVEPPPDLVSWWPGDGDGRDNRGVNDGALLGSAGFATGMVGEAFSFNGSGEVSAPTSGLPTGDSDRTLELWVMVNSIPDGESFFAGYGNFGAGEQTYHLGAAHNTLFFSQWGGAVFGPELQTGRWHHVAVSNVGTSITLYLDGEAVATGDLAIDTPRATQFFIGGLPSDSSKRLDGLVDEVRIYSRALSAAEIRSIFRAGGRTRCGAASASLDAPTPTTARSATPPTPPSVDTPSQAANLHPWWNDAIFYEIFVRSFQDSDGDGIGDFNGIRSRLDYLNDGDPESADDLGVTGLWLMPIHPSPTSHGYDVTDYRAVNPQYGTMDDFQRLLAEAHQRGIRVILDLVLNHTSSLHPWFLQSQDRQSPYRDWYVWSDADPGYLGPWNQVLWHPSPSGYYYGYFWEGMPDLNYTTPEVTEEMWGVARFWLEDVGVDGFRLDAIGALIEEGATMVETSATHQWLRDFNTYTESVSPDSLMVGEVWNPDTIVAPYVTNRYTDLAFEFDLASAILAGVNAQSAAPIRDALRTGTSLFPPGQYGTFLTNHDMARVMTQLGGDVGRARVAASILLTLPGVPFLYYGEEIGMVGEAPDAGSRRPMQWTAGPQAGFSTAPAWIAVDPGYRASNVEVETSDPTSLLSHYRLLLGLRNQHPALRSSVMDLVSSSQPGVFASLRVSEDEAILVIINLARAQVSDYRLSVSRSHLLAGGYSTESLMGSASFNELRIGTNGAFAESWIGPDLGAYGTLILRLVPR